MKKKPTNCIEATGDKMAELIATRVTNQGLAITPVIANLVIKEYLKAKTNYLMDNVSVEEPGLGITSMSWRRLPESFSSKRFTAKLVVDMDPTLKQLANNKLEDKIEL